MFVGQDWECLMKKYLDTFGDNEQIEAEISNSQKTWRRSCFSSGTLNLSKTI